MPSELIESDCNKRCVINWGQTEYVCYLESDTLFTVHYEKLIFLFRRINCASEMETIIIDSINEKISIGRVMVSKHAVEKKTNLIDPFTLEFVQGNELFFVLEKHGMWLSKSFTGKLLKTEVWKRDELISSSP